MTRKPVKNVTPDEFRKMVLEALADLPAPYDRLMQDVAVVIEEEPPSEVLKNTESDAEGELLGLYEGLSLADQSFFQSGGHQPPRIAIYRGPILRQCTTADEVRREIRDTVVHELGHHVGLDDDEMPY